MASPTNALAPNTPIASSPITGANALETWFQEIGQFIAAMSPASEETYEATTTATITDTTRWKLYNPTYPVQLIRRGKRTTINGVIANQTAGASTGATEVTIGTIPPGYRPSAKVYAQAARFLCTGSDSSTWLLTVTNSGLFQASRYSGTQSAGAWMPFTASWENA